MKMLSMYEDVLLIPAVTWAVCLVTAPTHGLCAFSPCQALDAYLGTF